MGSSELGCSYAMLILHDDGIAVTAEKINTILKAANVTVESYWPSLFAKLAQKKNIDDIILNAGSGGGAAAPLPVSGGAAAAGGAAEAAAPAKEEKKVEVEEESDDDMGFDLFN